MRISQGLKRAAQVEARKTALIDGSVRQSWSETQDRVARLASAFQGMGVGNDDRVAVLAMNGFRYYEVIYASMWAGGAVVPLNIRLAPPEIDYILGDSRPQVLCIDHNFVDFLPKLTALGQIGEVIFMGEGEAPAGTRSYEAVMAAHAPVDAADRSGADMAGIYYTGGTTGPAKGVILSHGNLVTNAFDVAQALHYTRDCSYLHAAPAFHTSDACSTYGLTMLAGQHVFMPRFEVDAFCRIVAAEAVTNTTMVPTMLGMLVDHPAAKAADLSALKRILVGGSSMPERTIRKALELMPGIRMHQAWGMTELSPIASVTQAKYATLDGPFAGKLLSCGQAVSSIELRIVAENGSEQPRGEVGELTARGPTVMQGYWNKPEETAAALRNGWLHSGDAAYMDEDGFVFIVDRIKDMIVTGGENVYCAEVENVLSLGRYCRLRGHRPA
ncbi:class I adenylate-forming enzyme family protein [Seohaeicola zhoushanensis]